MRPVIAILSLFVAVLPAVQLAPAEQDEPAKEPSVQLSPPLWREEPTKKPWAGKLSDGTVIREEDLKRILGERKKWVESKGKEGRKANLSNATLSKANLSDAHLSGTILTNADLSSATVSQTQLDEACGSDAKLPPGLTLKPCAPPK